MIYLALYDKDRHEVRNIETYKGKDDAEDSARRSMFDMEVALLAPTPWTVYASKDKAFSWEDVEHA